MTGKTIEGAIARAVGCVQRNAVPGQPMEIEHLCQWAVGAAFRYVKGEPEPGETISKPLEGEVLPPPSNAYKRAEAKGMGYTGVACSCGSFKTRQNGTCLVCDDCGTTTGCS